MPLTRKMIVYDLDTEALQKYYPNNNWRNAYNIIRKHMDKNGFDWLQGTTYVSRKSSTSVKVTLLLKTLVEENPWLNKCMRDCKEANVGNQYDRNLMFDKNADIPTREELLAQQQKTASMSDWKKQIDEMKKADKDCGKSEKPRGKHSYGRTER